MWQKLNSGQRKPQKQYPLPLSKATLSLLSGSAIRISHALLSYVAVAKFQMKMAKSYVFPFVYPVPICSAKLYPSPNRLIILRPYLTFHHPMSLIRRRFHHKGIKPKKQEATAQAQWLLVMQMCLYEIVSKQLFLSPVLELLLRYFAQSKRQAIKTESSEPFLKWTSLFRIVCRKFKLKHMLENSRDFEDK